ncbi:MAG: TonB-dependent receptor [Acidobacteria bacterium]|nr:TonB-dependent receptor [Acidobacteriota bacterium]
MKTFFTRLTPSFVAVLLSASAATAQIDTGSIVGTVTDKTGGVLPGITVTATQEETGVAQAAVTNSRGQYAFPNLKVGRYAVAAELQGFKRSVTRGLTLDVQDRLDVGFVLEIGQLSEEVVVSGRAELLHTQSADIGAIVDERTMRDLPLLGRRYSELALLAPGVVVAPAGITSRGEDTFFNANGNFATWNNYTLDGADNNSFSTNLQERSPQVVQPPVDALQEFKVQTRTYSAEFGKAAGAVINASVKQGANAVRGNVFTFARHEAFNANTWENDRAGLPKGKFNQGISGFTLGGPIVRGRTFFFGDYQRTDMSRALSQSATVPTPLMRQGVFTELTGAMTAVNPFVTAGCVNAVNKTVRSTCWDPVAAKLIGLYPMPNVPAAIAQQGIAGGFVTNNYVSNGILNYDINQFDLRADHTLTQNRDQMFVRYSFQNTNRREPPLLDDPIASGDFASNMLIRGQNAVGGWSHVFGSTLFSEFHAAWNRIRGDSVQPSFGIDADTQYGIKGVPRDPQFFGGLPHMPIARFTRLGGPFFRPQFQTSQVLQVADNVSWNRGSHNYKVGFEWRRDMVHYIDLQSLNGELNFADGRYTGFGIGDFLLGLSSTQRLTLFHEPDLYSNGSQLYAQDAWRATGSLTINYGLRYEYFTPMFDANNQLTNIIPETGEIVVAKDSGSVYDRTLINPERKDFAPRAGFAWSASPRTVLRGGYGIFYQQQDRYGSESQLGLNLPQLVDVAITANSANDPPALILSQGFTPLNASTVDKSRVQWRIQDPNQQTPIVQQFSIGPEQDLGWNTVASIEYVGNITRNGRRLRNLNEGIITTPGVGPVTFPYAKYGFGSAYLEQIVTNGRADYHALQLALRRRFTAGLGFSVAYTWSRAQGDFLDHLSAGGGAVGNFPGSGYAMEKDYGPLAFDIPRRFVTSFIYDLPVGRGRRVHPKGVAGAIVNDWVVNGILSLSDGRPFTITSNDRQNTGSGRISRADCVGDPVPSGFDQTIDGWFDPTAFKVPANFTYGNCGSNTVRGPGSKSMNLSVFRSLPMGDRRLEFRVETFNLFNWINWGFPGRSVSNLNAFGKITSTLGDPREMQFAIKFYF